MTTPTLESFLKLRSICVCVAVLVLNASPALAAWLDELPANVRSSILWFGDVEEGTLDDWNESHLNYPGGGVFNTPDVGHPDSVSEASRDVAHSGSYSAKNTIKNANGQSRGTRLFRWMDKGWDAGGTLFPQEVYFSTWMYLPRAYGTQEFWNVFQIKSKLSGGSKPVWTLNLQSNGDGTMSSYFYTKRNTPNGRPHNVSNPNIPVGEWFHLEAFVKQGNNNSGHLKFWINGQLAADWPNVTTTLDDHARWSINNYTGGIDGGTATIYYDDAAASTRALHPYIQAGTGGGSAATTPEPPSLTAPGRPYVVGQ